MTVDTGAIEPGDPGVVFVEDQTKLGASKNHALDPVFGGGIDDVDEGSVRAIVDIPEHQFFEDLTRFR